MAFELADLDGVPDVDWTEMAELVEGSYRRVALVRMLRRLQGGEYNGGIRVGVDMIMGHRRRR